MSFPIQTVLGDITKVDDLEAIVNAANNSLLGEVELMAPSTGRQGRSFWRNAVPCTDAKQGKRRSRRHIGCPVNT